MQAIILAAGKSSRFWPFGVEEHKSLIKIIGKPLIQHTIESFEDTEIDEVIIVQGPDKDIEKKLGKDVTDIDIRYVIQEESKGMGHAVKQAKDLVREQFFVMNPYRKNTSLFLDSMIEKSKETGAEMVLLSSETDTPWKYGVLAVDEDRADKIVEKPEKGNEPSNNKVVGLYLLPKDFFDYMEKVEMHEYQYEDAIQLYMDDNDVRVVFTDKNTSSIKYPWDLFDVTKDLFSTMEKHVSDSADIAESAVIDGDVWIGKDVKVFENAVIRGPCYIGDGCIIGNNSIVRDHTDLESGTIVGANCEVRGSILQEKTKIHQTFMGDSIMGRDCRIGAGTVTANRGRRINGERPIIKYYLQRKEREVETGLRRLGVIAGHRVEIGTHVNIMPGVGVGNDSFIGPKSIVKDNVDSGMIHYTDHQNVTKKDKRL